MLPPDYQTRLDALVARLTLGSEQWNRFMIYFCQLNVAVAEIIIRPGTRAQKQTLIQDEAERMLALTTNLVEPVIADDDEMPELPYVSDTLVNDVMGRFALAVGALMMVVDAWDTVKPIGWVGTAQGVDTLLLLKSVNNARKALKQIMPITEK